MTPLYTQIDTSQLWLWVVMPSGIRLVIDRAVPLPMPVIPGKTSV